MSEESKPLTVAAVLLEAKEELIWAEGHWGADYSTITKRIDALLESLSAAPEALRIPEGWKLVPVEPIEEMVNAAIQSLNGVNLLKASATGNRTLGSHKEQRALKHRLRYKAMLAASPSPSSSVPCARCGGAVVEFTVPNDVWNTVVRRGGKEGDDEYICEGCYRLAVEAWVRAL